MSPFLRVLENEVQIAALLFMAVVYVLRLVWLFRFRSAPERTYAAGNAGAGVALLMLNVAMPWAMESTRRKPLFYVQFVIFHIGVALAIAWSANLYNFMDGSDGMAALMAVVGFAAYGFAAETAGSDGSAYFALAAAVLPFLVVNLPPARILAATIGDKKSRRGRVRYALPAGLGQMARDAGGNYGLPVDDRVVLETLQEAQEEKE